MIQYAEGILSACDAKNVCDWRSRTPLTLRTARTQRFFSLHLHFSTRFLLLATAATQAPFTRDGAPPPATGARSAHLATEPFQGNPAAVLVMPPSQFYKENAAEWMQRVAIENNLSETAYTTKRDVSNKETSDGVVEYDLRWFSPAGEEKKLVQMDFPRGSLQPVLPGISKEQVAASIGISPESVIAVEQIGTTTDVLLHVDAAVFPSIRPDFAAIAQIEARALIVTTEVAENAQQVDFESRVFAPGLGVNEDPVTGSAHCGLVSYWSARLNKTSLLAKQSAPVRGGYIAVEVVSNNPDRVLLKGEAVVSLRGFLETTP
ncbi:putative isomerase, partial [Globisporangium splendens]